MNSSTYSPSAIRKAAIVISTLDTASANALLDKMPPDAAEEVRQMLRELSDIPPAEQDEVLREFMSAGGLAHPDEFEGVELDPGLAEKLRSQESLPTASPSSDQVETPPQPPFRFLHQATPDVLAKHLERQYPQVIAVVAAHLPPQQAAEVIKRFKPKLQAEVLRRIAELDFADQDALRDIEKELESLLSDDLRVARNRQSGLAAVSTILNAAGSQRTALLNNLSEHERDLARHLSDVADRSADLVALPNAPRRGYVHQNVGAQPDSSVGPRSRDCSHDSVPTRSGELPHSGERSHDNARLPRSGERSHAATAGLPRSGERSHSLAGHMRPGERSHENKFVPTEPVMSGREIDFEELSLLKDDDWAVLIRAAEPSLVILALTGASEQLLRRITRQLSKRESQALRSRLQVTGPLRLSDIEQAQRNIARLAVQLAERGEIHLPERRAFAAAA